MEEHVILVDSNDSEIGIEEKMSAHLKGKLHRAFSIFIFNDKGELMLQKRHSSKYHSGGLWTNTCCSHPRPGEPIQQAVHRRLKEEMGFDCELKEAFSFVYTAKLDHGLTEHEYNHVFVGKFNGSPKLNSHEAEDWKWIDPAELLNDIRNNPNKYASWFKICVERVLNGLANLK